MNKIARVEVVRNRYQFLRNIGAYLFICSSILICKDDAPNWVKTRPVMPGYYIGIGYSEKSPGINHRERAKANALNDLASEISVTISSELVDVMTEYSGLSEEYARSEIRMQTQEELDAHERVDDWDGKNEYWVFYRLSNTYFDQYTEAARQHYEYFLMSEGEPYDQLQFLVASLENIFRAVGRKTEYEIDGRRIDLRVQVPFEFKKVLSSIDFSGTELNREALHGRSIQEPFIVTAQDEYGAPINSLPIKFAFLRGSGSFSNDKQTIGNRGQAKTKVDLVESRQENQIVRATVNLLYFKSADKKRLALDRFLEGIADTKPVDFSIKVSVLKRDKVGVVVVGTGLSNPQLESLNENFNTEFTRTDFVIMDRNLIKEILARERYDPRKCTTPECRVEMGKLLGVDKLIFVKVNHLITDRMFDCTMMMRDVYSKGVGKQKTKKVKYSGQSGMDHLFDKIPDLVSEFIKFINPGFVSFTSTVPGVRVNILNTENREEKTRSLDIHNEELTPGLYRFEFQKIGYEPMTMPLNIEVGEQKGRIPIILRPKTRGTAFLKSLIFPGAGQYYSSDGDNKGRKRAGLMFRLGTLAVLGGAAYMWNDYAQANQEYNDAYETYKSQTDLDLITQYRIIAEEKNNTVKNSETLALLVTGIAGTVWLGGAIEAAVNFPDFGRRYGDIKLSLGGNPYTNAPGINISLEF